MTSKEREFGQVLDRPTVGTHGDGRGNGHPAGAMTLPVAAASGQERGTSQAARAATIGKPSEWRPEVEPLDGTITLPNSTPVYFERDGLVIEQMYCAGRGDPYEGRVLTRIWRRNADGALRFVSSELSAAK